MLVIKSATELFRDGVLLGKPLDSFANHQLNPSDVQLALEAWETTIKAEHDADLKQKNDRAAALRADKDTLIAERKADAAEHRSAVEALKAEHAAKLAEKDAAIAELQAEKQSLKARTREGRKEQAVAELAAAEAARVRKAEEVAAIEAEA